MSCEINFCKKCLKKIKRNGSICFNLFIDICESYVSSKKTVCKQYKGNGDVVIEVLEKNGFIITTECSKSYLMIKPLGLKQILKRKKTVYKICFKKRHKKKIDKYLTYRSKKKAI